MSTKRKAVAAVVTLLGLVGAGGAEAEAEVGVGAGVGGRKYYEHSSWRPRLNMTVDEVLSGRFCPPSWDVGSNYDYPAFEDARLRPAPAPGVHPRTLLTPGDADEIRAKIAQGDKAPAAFRVMWERVRRKQGALYAYIAQDEALGRKLAAELIGKARGLGPKLDRMEQYPDRDNLWTVEKSMGFAADPLSISDLWQLADYDLLHQWLSDDERRLVRGVISRATTGRFSNFLNVPDHFMINNHQCFGMSLMPLLLCIEGEEGFDKRVYEAGVRKMRAMLDFYLTKDGMCYETIKGWLPVSAYVAVARRERDLLKHSHLRGKMDYFAQAIRWERPSLARPAAWQPPSGKEAAWVIRDEMRASAFHFIWMMRYFNRSSPAYDFLYQATFSSHDFLTSPDARWPDPVGIDDELLLLWAEDGGPTDWTDPKQVAALKLPLTWKDDQRGYLVARNSWRPDDLAVNFAVKSEYYYGGHEGSEFGRFTLWSGGVNWALDNPSLFFKQANLQNGVTVNGMGIHWPPVAGQWLGLREAADGTAVAAAGDYKDAYSYFKATQIHPLAFPSATTTYQQMFSAGNYALDRSYQVAFHDEMVRFYDRFAHTDYGTWSGEHRLVEGYRRWNPMERAFRTLQLGRGERPYVLIADDLRKDPSPNEWAWNMVLPDDVQVVRTVGMPDLLGGIMPSDPHIEMDIVLGRTDTPRNTSARIVQHEPFSPRRGDPQMLVRVLRRNTQGWTLPRVERVDKFNVLVVPARAVEPDFVVMLFPMRAGDPAPRTRWSEDGTRLTVDTGTRTDVYTLARTDAGRTVFSLERDGKQVQASGEGPAAPRLLVRGRTFDLSDARGTRDEGKVPTYLVGDSPAEVRFERPATGRIHYTLDGTDPTAASSVYSGALSIAGGRVLKARVIDDDWTAGPTSSRLLEARFEARTPAQGTKSGGESGGLLARVYELQTVIWDDKGFWRADKVMLPDLRREKPLVSRVTPGVEIPPAVPAAPMVEQRKGFYRFTGFVNVQTPGVHEFAVDSCGPVTLDVAGQTVIEHTGQFHQQQAVRRGEAVLGAGWHAIELVVTDPLFWKVNTDGPMPLKLTVRVDGGPERELTAEQLSCTLPADPAPTPAPAAAQLSPEQDLLKLVPGLVRRDFDRSQQFKPFVPPPADWLDFRDVLPDDQRLVDVVSHNLSEAMVVEYEGYFYAPVPGEYRFELPRRSDSGITGDQIQAAFACLSKLTVGGEVLLQHGVPGRVGTGRARFTSPGYYRLSLRMGRSLAGLNVTYPDGQTLAVGARELWRPAWPEVTVGGEVAGGVVEVYGPADVAASLPKSLRDAGVTLRYTLDGTPSTADSPLYTAPIRAEGDMMLSVVGFEGTKAVTNRNTVAIKRVEVPTEGLIARVAGDTLTPGGNAWVAPGATLSRDESPARAAIAVHGGSRGDGARRTSTRPVDANLDKGTGGAGLRVTGLRLPRNAITVAGWVRLADVKEGRLAGKWGFNAIGKRFRTITLEVRNGRLRADPGVVSGGTLEAGRWHHVAVSADAGAIVVYLDGKAVARGDGTDAVATDSMDFCQNLPADLADVRIYARVLSEADIARLADRKQ